MENQNQKVIEFRTLDEFSGGWFVGAFTPSLFHTTAFEVAVQHFSAGEKSLIHVHRIAEEITVVVSGEATLNGRRIYPGSIVRVPAGVAAGFEAVTDVTTVVVKMPSVPGDKYRVDKC